MAAEKRHITELRNEHRVKPHAGERRRA